MLTNNEHQISHRLILEMVCDVVDDMCLEKSILYGRNPQTQHEFDLKKKCASCVSSHFTRASDHWLSVRWKCVELGPRYKQSCTLREALSTDDSVSKRTSRYLAICSHCRFRMNLDNWKASLLTLAWRLSLRASTNISESSLSGWKTLAMLKSQLKYYKSVTKAIRQICHTC